MKLFQNLLSGKNKCRIIAPVSGKLVSVKEAKDPTFRDEILGKSVTVIPSENRFYSPADGVVTTVFPTGHAVAITTTDGAEVLIHVGINTVKLNGKFFNLHVKEGQKVSAGDLLLEADIEQIQKEGYQIITPIIICNTDEFTEVTKTEPRDISVGDTVMTLKK